MQQNSIFGGVVETHQPAVVRPRARPWENKRQAIEVASLHGNVKVGFATWLDNNWPIFARFSEEADKLRNRGRTHYSARTIAEVIRHETALSDAQGGFKIDDHWTPSMARLYVALTPGAEDFFETRARKLQ